MWPAGGGSAAASARASTTRTPPSTNRRPRGRVGSAPTRPTGPLCAGRAAVHETLRVGVVPVQVQLPQGPYLRVAGTGVGLTLVGQTLSGDFAFERTLDAGGHAIVRLQASNVSAGLGGNGTPVLALTGGSGSLVVTSTGTAGPPTGDSLLTAPRGSLR